MAHPDHVYEAPGDRAARLARFGLTEKLVTKIVLYGFGARAACSALHPPSFPGYAQWAETHYAARVELVPLGWTPDDTSNFSRIVDPHGLMAFTVSTGDDNTGNPGLPEPSTKHPRGSETSRAIKINQQLSMFDDPEEIAVHAFIRARLETWTLLIATTTDEVHFELSLGADQDSQGRITRWSERIVFPPLEINAAAMPGQDDEDDGLSDIDVPVERL